MAARGSRMLRAAIMRAREVRVQPLWDRQDIDSTVDVTFFNTARTGTIAGNMQIPGQLPAPQQFLVKGISFYPNAGLLIADHLLVFNNVVLTLYIADKEYLRVPAWMCPGGGGLTFAGGALTAAAGLEQWINGHPLHYNYFRVTPHILIPEQQNFRVVSSGNQNTAAAYPATVVLWGTQERAVQ